MGQQVVVIGLGRFGSALAEELVRAGHEVMGVDTDHAVVQRMAPLLTHVVQIDVMDETVVESLGLSQFDAGVVGISEHIEASILTTLLLKRAGVRRVIAKANNALHGDILLRVGADRVVFPERDTGQRLAHSWGSAEILDSLDVMPGYIVTRVGVPPAAVGQTIEQYMGADSSSLTLFVIARRGRVTVHPTSAEVLRDGDTLVLSGTIADVERFFERHH